MKKNICAACIMAMAALTFAGCSNTSSQANAETTAAETTAEETTAAETTTAEETTAESETDAAVTEAAAETDEDGEIEYYDGSIGRLNPLPTGINLNNLNNCTVNVGFDSSDAYMNGGQLRLRFRVYAYDTYDAVGMNQLQPGDQIMFMGDILYVDSIRERADGTIEINGGEDEGGYDFAPMGGGTYCAKGADDIMYWNYLGDADLPIDQEFVMYDSADLSMKEYTAGSFLITGTDGINYNYDFTPYNTSLSVQNGYVTEIDRAYTP